MHSDSQAAARYIKDSITTIAVHEEMTACWGKWSTYATLQPRGTFPDDLPTYDSYDDVEAAAEAKARGVPSALDADRDGIVTRPELTGWINGSGLAEHDAIVQAYDAGSPSKHLVGEYSRAEVLAQLQAELAANIFNYHDANADNVLTVAELAHNIEEWIRLNNDGRSKPP